MIGHRSLAEMYAKEVLSEVEESAVDVSMDLFWGGIGTYEFLRRSP